MTTLKGTLVTNYQLRTQPDGATAGLMTLRTGEGVVLADLHGAVAQSASGLRGGDSVVVEGKARLKPWVCKRTGRRWVARRIKTKGWRMA